MPASNSPYGSMAAMMGQKSGSAGVPTQGFAAQNILGTPSPLVGDNKARPNYAAGMGGVNNLHVALMVVGAIGIGYLVFHFNFEK